MIRRTHLDLTVAQVLCAYEAHHMLQDALGQQAARGCEHGPVEEVLVVEEELLGVGQGKALREREVAQWV